MIEALIKLIIKKIIQGLLIFVALLSFVPQTRAADDAEATRVRLIGQMKKWKAQAVKAQECSEYLETHRKQFRSTTQALECSDALAGVKESDAWLDGFAIGQMNPDLKLGDK